MVASCRSDIDNKTKLQALTLINDCNKYKMDLATGGAICSEALRYVTQKQEQINTLQMLDKRIEESKENGQEEEEDDSSSGSDGSNDDDDNGSQPPPEEPVPPPTEPEPEPEP
jgi:hypothetical protein